MNLSFYLRRIQQRLHASHRTKPSAAQSRRTVRLCLEQLGGRIVPSTLAPATTDDSGNAGNACSCSCQTTETVPQLYQAMWSLLIDGAYLETVNQSLRHEDYNNAYTLYQLNMGPPPSAAAMSFENALLPWLNFLSQIRGDQLYLSAVVADIGANLPSAGPFGLISLMAGAQAVNQSVPQ